MNSFVLIVFSDFDQSNLTWMACCIPGCWTVM